VGSRSNHGRPVVIPAQPRRVTHRDAGKRRGAEDEPRGGDRGRPTEGRRRGRRSRRRVLILLRRRRAGQEESHGRASSSCGVTPWHATRLRGEPRPPNMASGRRADLDRADLHREDARLARADTGHSDCCTGTEMFGEGQVEPVVHARPHDPGAPTGGRFLQHPPVFRRSLWETIGGCRQELDAAMTGTSRLRALERGHRGAVVTDSLVTLQHRTARAT